MADAIAFVVFCGYAAVLLAFEIRAKHWVATLVVAAVAVVNFLIWEL